MISCVLYKLVKAFCGVVGALTYVHVFNGFNAFALSTLHLMTRLQCLCGDLLHLGRLLDHGYSAYTRVSTYAQNCCGQTNIDCPPSLTIQEIHSYVGASVRYFEVNAKNCSEVQRVFQETVAIPYINETIVSYVPCNYIRL